MGGSPFGVVTDLDAGLRIGKSSEGSCGASAVVIGLRFSDCLGFSHVGSGLSVCLGSDVP